MSSDFGYINARVRGMSADLLEPEFFMQALGDSDFRAFLGTLAQTRYGASLEEAQGAASGLEAVDRALARDFYATTRSLLSFSDGAPHRLIALVLRRYDLANLKTIARAKHAGRTPEQVENAIMPAGEIKPSLLETLAAAPDLPAVAQALAVTRHPLSRAFARAARKYASDGDLYAFELALDRDYFDTLFATIDDLDPPREFRRHMQREVDATNLRTALKLRGRGVDPDDVWVKGGREITRGIFDAILSGADGALSALAQTSFAAVADADTVADAERVIRSVLDTSAKRVAHREPLNIGVVLAFLREKEAETARLRLLARGKFYDVPRDQLERELAHG